MPKHPLSKLVLLFSILFGAFIRLYPGWSAGFPVNDGGLFYRMTQELVSSGFRLPLYTTYNELHIPFAYPALPFYLAGWVHQVLNIPLIEVIRWLPALISIFTVPTFFWLARILFRDDDKAAVATLFFTFMPRSFEWLIMGGGLTRAPAALFFLLFTGSLLKVFRDQERRSIWYAILFGGLVVLSHPERSLHALTMGLFFFIFFARTKRGLIDASLIGAGVGLITAPWWAANVIRFGLEPMLQASQAGGDRALFWSPLLLLNFSDETIAVTGLLGVIGMMYELSNRRWFLPLWAVLPFLIDPRSAPHIAPIQFSLLAGIALTEVILPALAARFDATEVVNSKTWKFAIAYFLILGLVNGLLNAFTLSRIRLTSQEREALMWISQNVPTAGHTFLLYSRGADVALSPLLEWFPALTSQTSLSTFQGREWLSGQLHSDAFFESREKWLACAGKDEKCLEDWMNSSGEDVEYVLLALNAQYDTKSLARSLQASTNFDLRYHNEEVEIYQRVR